MRLRALAVCIGAVAILLLAACTSNEATIGPTDKPSGTETATDVPETGPTDPPTASPSPTPEPTLEPGSREAPLPIGTPVSYSDGWEIVVVSTLPNANAAVQAENQFNSPPAAGNQFFIATVSLTYSGEGSDTFSGSSLEAVGPSNVGYTNFGNSCGVIPDDVPFNEVFSGGTIQGNVCWEIVSTDAAELLMYYDPIFSFDSTERIYWRLAP